MKKLVVLLSIAFVSSSLLAQDFITHSNYPELKPEQGYRLKSGSQLPDRVNNGETKFFPPIISQHGWSCNQAASIGYTLTYEMNRLRNLDSNEWVNQYAPLFPWNFLNRCVPGAGVSYFDSWEVVKSAGCTTFPDFPNYNNTKIWMSGYDKYYRTMQNRIVQNYSIHVGSPEGLLVLKNYLYDHLDGSDVGGVANVQIASGGMIFRYALDNGPDPGAPVLVSFGESVGHALTVIGYDDNIRVDINNDGRSTNDEDVDGNGVIDMRDWEIGALILANTWGRGWGRDGFAYCSYSCLGREGHRGGIWGRSVHVIKAVKEYEPVMTMKVVMDHTSRNKFKLLAGVASDPEATEPEHIMGFAHFSYQGDADPLFSDDPDDTTRFELGIDISGLTSYIEPGQDTKFFLLVDEKDPTDQGKGKIRSFSIINYNGEEDEVVSDQYDVPILNDQTTTMSLVRTVDFNKVQIAPETATSIEPGVVFTKNLTVEGGEAPFLWELVQDYTEEHFERSYPQMAGDTLVTSSSIKQFTWVDLPFNFPLYGEDHRAIIVDKNGGVHFNNEYYDYPYAVDTDLVFQVRRSVLPLSRELEYSEDDDQVCVLVTDSVARVMWNATVVHRSEEYDVQFSVYLYADGRIEFHYGPFDQPAGPMYEWITGISLGDSRHSKVATVSELGILFQNYGSRFKPLEYPGEVTLSDEGLLSCKPTETDRIWNIYVQVRDKNNQIDFGAVPVSTVNWEETDILTQNFPNPFSSITAIGFKIPTEQSVSLKIFDSSGRYIKTLVEQQLTAGEYTYYWNGTNVYNKDLAPGNYYYRLTLTDQQITKKIVLIR